MQGKQGYAGKRFLESWLVLEFCDRCGELRLAACPSTSLQLPDKGGAAPEHVVQAVSLLSR